MIERTDTRLVPEAQEEITPGEAMAGMSLNGVGFANRPLSLTPQFFANTALDLWCREGVHAELFNRCTLGHTRDEGAAYGGDLLCSARALAVCVQEGIDQRCNHLDTTSFALSGDYVPESDEHALHLPDGDATDHRPDVKPAVLERMVSQDGGVPVVSQRGDGHAADTQMCQARAEAPVSNACQRASDAIKTQLCHVHAQRFETPEGAKAALAALENPWTDH